MENIDKDLLTKMRKKIYSEIFLPYIKNKNSSTKSSVVFSISNEIQKEVKDNEN